jgi:hypothetical protein
MAKYNILARLFVCKWPKCYCWAFSLHSSTETTASRQIPDQQKREIKRPIHSAKIYKKKQAGPPYGSAASNR